MPGKKVRLKLRCICCSNISPRWEMAARLLEGKSIGIKRIRVLPRKVNAGDIRLAVKSETGVAPKMKKTRFYRVNGKLLESVLSATENSGETDTAKWMDSARR